MLHRNARKCNRMINSCIQRFKFSTDASTTTYYDSQSGQHVAIHDERKITAYLRNADRTGAAALSSSSSCAILKAAKEMGMAGSVISLPQQVQRQDDSGMVGFIEALGSSSNSSSVFLHISPSQYHDLVVTKEKQHRNNTIIHSNINLCFEYNNDGEHIANNVQSAMTNFEGVQTSIGIFHPKYLLDDEPMLVAAQVASLIDTTFEFGGAISNILVAPIMMDNDDDTTLTSYDDELVQLCEELSYLDVPGSTIKSRLVVPTVSGDQLEECLQMGITKYIIDASSSDGSVESRLDVLRDAVEESGKELILNVMK